jgi:hypothetical protein
MNTAALHGFPSPTRDSGGFNTRAATGDTGVHELA